MFPLRLKELRKEKKITQSKLAELMYVDQTTVSCWEKGKAMPDTEKLKELSKLFDVSVDYLLGVEGKNKILNRRIKDLLSDVDDYTDFANALGIDPYVIFQWISGISDTCYNKLFDIASYFHVSIEYLLGIIDTPFNNNISEISVLDTRNIYHIPLYESVSAGFGAYASDYVIDYYPCYIPSESEAQETLCIKVSGDSMYPKIEDGDIIQVHKQSSVDSGSIAVVLVDKTEALVKKIVYGENWIELHSINPMYPVQRFNERDVLRIEVLGLVKKIIKDI